MPVASTVLFSCLQEVDSSVVTSFKLVGSVSQHITQSWNDSAILFTVSQLVALLENSVICRTAPQLAISFRLDDSVVWYTLF